MRSIVVEYFLLINIFLSFVFFFFRSVVDRATRVERKLDILILTDDNQRPHNDEEKLCLYGRKERRNTERK